MEIEEVLFTAMCTERHEREPSRSGFSRELAERSPR
jgi:hypothetical protein